MEQFAVNDVVRDTRVARRRVLFILGDCVFLVAVGVATTVVTHVVHQIGWSVWITCPLGMAVAMVIQMLMAVCASPLLGSIETMTPSMVLGMLGPMPVCALHIFGGESTHATAVMWGVGTGLLMFAFVLWYSMTCERRLQGAIGSNQDGLSDLGQARSTL